MGFLFTNLKSQSTVSQTVYFDYDQYKLTSEAQLILNQLAEKIKAAEVVNIKIIGHTDLDGGEAYNQSLSQNRANTVLQYLTGKGCMQQLFEVSYLGEAQPVKLAQDELSKQLNRRVEIIYEMNGFVIPKTFKVDYTNFKINPARDTIVKVDKKGTTIHIPKNAFTCKGGIQSGEQVSLQYREYCNSADMAFSGIKMTYREKGESYNFNSSGMFEIKGSVGKKEAQIADGKTLKVDYALAKQNPDISFFQLNSKTNEWKKVQEIEKNNNAAAPQPVNVEADTSFVFEVINGRAVLMENGVQIDNLKGGGINQGFVVPKMSGTLLAENVNAGHTYPDIVKGLNVGEFGVYNCDQIYRIPNLVSIKASYFDANGKEIKNTKVLSLIDMDYNGAFSFSPEQFNCNALGKNALALFTKSGELYLLNPDEYAKIGVNKNGTYKFTMVNMTNEIKNSKDLATYLGIKS